MNSHNQTQTLTVTQAHTTQRTCSHSHTRARKQTHSCTRTTRRQHLACFSQQDCCLEFKVSTRCVWSAMPDFGVAYTHCLLSIHDIQLSQQEKCNGDHSQATGPLIHLRDSRSLLSTPRGYDPRTLPLCHFAEHQSANQVHMPQFRLRLSTRAIHMLVRLGLMSATGTSNSHAQRTERSPPELQLPLCPPA